MARWTAPSSNWTPAIVADTTGYAANSYHAIIGGSSTQRINLWDMWISGLASVTSPMELILARDSTVAVGATAAMFNANDPATAALAAPPVSFKTVATTQPQRSSTLYLYTPAFNGFGGAIRWAAMPGEEMGMLGNTASFGELSISMKSGTASAVSSTFVVEPF